MSIRSGHCEHPDCLARVDATCGDLNAAADRIEALEATMRAAYDLLHNLTAIIPGNDAAYALTTQMMARIRADIKDIT
jgi:hypothetical protein